MKNQITKIVAILISVTMALSGNALAVVQTAPGENPTNVQSPSVSPSAAPSPAPSSSIASNQSLGPTTALSTATPAPSSSPASAPSATTASLEGNDTTRSQMQYAFTHTNENFKYAFTDGSGTQYEVWGFGLSTSTGSVYYRMTAPSGTSGPGYTLQSRMFLSTGNIETSYIYPTYAFKNQISKGSGGYESEVSSLLNGIEFCMGETTDLQKLADLRNAGHKAETASGIDRGEPYWASSDVSSRSEIVDAGGVRHFYSYNLKMQANAPVLTVSDGIRPGWFKEYRFSPDGTLRIETSEKIPGWYETTKGSFSLWARGALGYAEEVKELAILMMPMQKGITYDKQWATWTKAVETIKKYTRLQDLPLASSHPSTYLASAQLGATTIVVDAMNPLDLLNSVIMISVRKMDPSGTLGTDWVWERYMFHANGQKIDNGTLFYYNESLNVSRVIENDTNIIADREKLNEIYNLLYSIYDATTRASDIFLCRDLVRNISAITHVTPPEEPLYTNFQSAFSEGTLPSPASSPATVPVTVTGVGSISMTYYSKVFIKCEDGVYRYCQILEVKKLGGTTYKFNVTRNTFLVNDVQYKFGDDLSMDVNRMTYSMIVEALTWVRSVALAKYQIATTNSNLRTRTAAMSDAQKAVANLGLIGVFEGKVRKIIDDWQCMDQSEGTYIIGSGIFFSYGDEFFSNASISMQRGILSLKSTMTENGNTHSFVVRYDTLRGEYTESVDGHIRKSFIMRLNQWGVSQYLGEDSMWVMRSRIENFINPMLDSIVTRGIPYATADQRKKTLIFVNNFKAELLFRIGLVDPKVWGLIVRGAIALY